ncbi:MgtC/SapB family protein [Phenylobacterium soli]|uniref:Protein MgtC n=1 Tax=Phenylobacterium soli TaxID=2170551 RepID=A0A328AHB8_9CAUL|nr:MgtC/SapB family protein [Phenylobacterium soli]RAK54140.1 MgtC/SapB family protein [Phenylobacterium soli]
MIDVDTPLRLLAGVGVTFLMGLERSRRIPSVGARTFGMIGLAGATAALTSVHYGGADPALLGRVLQGVLMGVGFVGAGVIMHRACRQSLHGVTTAAAIWVAALVGFAAGLADWPLLVGAAVLSILLLMLPEPLQAGGRSKAAPRADQGG